MIDAVLVNYRMVTWVAKDFDPPALQLNDNEGLNAQIRQSEPKVRTRVVAEDQESLQTLGHLRR